MVQRFEYLAVILGKMPEAITHNGQAISVVPLSPLQKAQNQDKVMVTRSNLDLAVQAAGPEGMAQLVDLRKTFTNIIKASGDELLAVATGDANAASAPVQ